MPALGWLLNLGFAGTEAGADETNEVTNWTELTWDEWDTFGWNQWDTFLWGGIRARAVAGDLFSAGGAAGDVFSAGGVAGDLFSAGATAAEVTDG